MHVTLLGAAGEVTGSAYHVQTATAGLLVDFGFFQGTRMAEESNVIPPTLDIAKLDAVVVTHGHLDHVGRLPLLAKRGFNRPIYATPASIEVAGLILRDSARIQESDVTRLNRKRERAGDEPVEPLYTPQDVETVLKLFKPLRYGQPSEVAPGITAEMLEAGHILGSASIRLRIEEKGVRRTVVFSGDLGQHNAPLLPDPASIDAAHTVFLESTYGDRDHRSFDETIAEMLALVKTAVERKARILVPSFAVGRTQTVVYLITEMFRSGELPRFPIYIDSPMAIEATKIYSRYPLLMDAETQAAQRDPEARFDSSHLRLCLSAEESKALNDVAGPCLILAGAGMCNGGRIVHHLKQNLWRHETTVLIVGYQSPASLGRQLLDGAKHVRIFGEPIVVNATIRGLGGLSAHAGQTDLLRWFEPMADDRPQVVLTHGEEDARKPLARLIQERFGLNARRPLLGDTVNL